VYWNPNGWGHVSSVESKFQKYFLHINDFVCDRVPLLGERIKFVVAPPFGHSKSPNRLLRAAQARPWTPDEPAGEAATNDAEVSADASSYDCAKLLSGAGVKL